ncbi:MAG TPA: aminopeptidase P N-terminal domain-containing protein [Vicinamibacterales bacterium]|jgi:Xaa-Pro aminopeptidase|nr:aminopeptidase P N-terminal domain-containing protein [Vicinamibacterales bacterium]
MKLRRVRSTVFVLMAVIALLVAASARASDLSDDLKARRARVMERLGPDAIAIVWSAPAARYSLDIDYEYRQDSNLYYLTGVTQEDTILVLMPGAESRREILFVRDRDPLREHWTGRRLTHEEATARTGIETVMWTSQFERFVSSMLDRRGVGSVDDKQAAKFFDALAAGRARVALPLEAGRGVNDPLTAALDFARKIRERFVGFQVIDSTPILTALRLVKTPYERSVLTRSLEISSEAQMAGMRAARADAYEYEVTAAIEAVHRARGASSWSYPSIVGSGPNATILHYHGGDRQMHTGDLILVDAAANYQYASGDITRTYPVNGTFSPLQRDIYAIVLQAQDEGMKVAKAGASLEDIHKKTVEVVKAGLLKLGLITDTSGDQYRMWYTHGASHYIGIDVHDVGDRRTPLAPGMAFVIEPGIYIRAAALEALPRTPENTALIEKIEPAVKKYSDIGVRIEDSFLLEENGLRRLSASVPRTIEEIESFLRKRPSRSTDQR